MTPPTNDPLRGLLQENEWLRSFVRTLVPARHVDDIVQSTAVAALEARCVAQRPRDWLRGIAKNLARMLHRSSHRSRQRESRGARNTHAMATADVVAALEVQHAVSAALLALPEPTRTIVVLRYQEGLSPADIAQRLGLQAAAIRQRLTRGRAMVRARLQQEFGPDWRGCAMVVAFAGRDGLATTSVSAISLVAIGATLLLLTTLLMAITWPSDRRDVVAATTVNGAPARDAASMPSDTADKPSPATASTTRSLAASSDQDPQVRPPASEAAMDLRGRIVKEEDGEPIVGATVIVNAEWRRGGGGNRPAYETVTTATDGRFTIAWPKNAVRLTLWFGAEDRSRRWHYAEQPRSIDLGDIPLVRGVAVRGRVVDEKERPMEGVRIAVQIDGEFPQRGGGISFATSTAADGSFESRDFVPEGETTLLCETEGVQLVDSTIDVTGDRPPKLFVLQARRLPAIRGVVFGPGGVPCAGIALEATDPQLAVLDDARGNCLSKKDGTFALFCEHGEPSKVVIRTSRHASHELAGDPVACEWGTSGVRIDVRPRIPVHLRLVEAGTRRPIERFTASASQRVGDTKFTRSGGDRRNDHEGGVVEFDGLAAGTRILLDPADPALPPMQVVVDESMRNTPIVDLSIARMESFAVTLVDARGAAVASEFHVLDRCGDESSHGWNDPRGGRTCSTSWCLRLSGGATDAEGHGELFAPRDRPALVIALRRGDRDVWLPLVLPPGNSLRLVVPD